MGQGAFDLESLPGGDQPFTLEYALERSYLVLGPTGEVGDGPFMDLAVFSPSFPKENGGPRVSIGDAIDIHGNMYTLYNFPCQEKNKTIHGNVLQKEKQN
jgi:hypothetical protein